MRRAVMLAVLAGALAAAPEKTVPLRDLRPGFVDVGRLLRSRTDRNAGLFVAGLRYRGLNAPVPSRAGFDLDACFARLRIRVGVLDGSEGAARFRLLGDGRVLASTPPLFAGAAPIELDVPLDNVLLLELVTEGDTRTRAAWIDGQLTAAPGRDLTAFLPLEASFSPREYPVAFRRRVNEAIDRGVAHLRSTQGRDGHWQSRHNRMGVTALVTLALLKSGVPADAPCVVGAFAALRPLPYDHVYSVSILLMALEARYFPGGADEKDAYRERPRLAKKIIPEEEQVWIRDAALWLADQQGKGLYPVWRYPQGGYDLSNTQYALFGLSAANRCGVPTSKVWLPTLRFLLGAQEKDGPEVDVSRYVPDRDYLHRRQESARARGFGYVLDADPTGSMTSAGLCSLILCHQALYRTATYRQQYSGQTRAAIRDALAWLEEYYDVEENPMRGRTWWEYYLYNVERAGVLLDQRYIGTRDWYEEGAEALLARQASTGAFGDTVNTCFALLFLKRATVPAITNPLR